VDREPDDLEAAVEAEWQAENKAALEVLRSDSGGFTLPPSRDSIRARLLRERQQAEEAELRRLRLERERADAERRAVPELEPLETTQPAVAANRSEQSQKGRGLGAVATREANKAAEIYLANRKLYDTLSDNGAYAVHKLYTDVQEEPVLKRAMVGHLIVAIRNGWLLWDTEQASLKIPLAILANETDEEMFRIPRSKLAS
jgi:hypothetical protein